MLRVLSLHPERKAGSAQWECICDCGEKSLASSKNLRSGDTKSCGCQSAAKPSHGHCTGRTSSKTYRAWHSMIQRCYSPSQRCYPRYGGRGVRVCDRWNPKAGGCFENFLADMGVAPEGKTLDKDKLGGIGNKLYSPENCCWLTTKEQNQFRRPRGSHPD